MVPAEGFEPPTFGLQNRCTTTVLSRQRQMRSAGSVLPLGSVVSDNKSRIPKQHRKPRGLTGTDARRFPAGWAPLYLSIMAPLAARALHRENQSPAIQICLCRV